MKICPKCKSPHDKVGTFCSRKCANSRSHSEETKRKQSLANSGRYPHNKGITGKRHSDSTKKRISESLLANESLRHLRKTQGERARGRKSSPETKAKLSRIALARAAAGTFGGSWAWCNSKRGSYKGIRCDSSWELAFVVYHLALGHLVFRCTESRVFLWSGVQRTYRPDFVLDGKVVEVKGYITEFCRAKLEQNPDVVLYDEDRMRLILETVRQEHGEDFTHLYE